MPALAEIYRHPVKSLGEEALTSVTLTAGEAMPWDRVWAVAHDRSLFNPAEPEWAKSRNFVIQCTNPALAQIIATFDDATETLTLKHPALGEISVKPGAEGDKLTDWLAPIAGASGPGPYRLAHVPGRRLHDFPDSDISIGNLASLRALEQMAGMTLERIRFRMNFWVDGLAPWEEAEWEKGASIGIGDARFEIIGPAKRCTATGANPSTGKFDAEITKILYNRFRHMFFGVYAQVRAGGDVSIGDEVTS